jgi:hypothetical protein
MTKRQKKIKEYKIKQKERTEMFSSLKLLYEEMNGIQSKLDILEHDIYINAHDITMLREEIIKLDKEKVS